MPTYWEHADSDPSNVSTLVSEDGKLRIKVFRSSSTSHVVLQLAILDEQGKALIEFSPIAIPIDAGDLTLHNLSLRIPVKFTGNIPAAVLCRKPRQAFPGTPSEN